MTPADTKTVVAWKSTGAAYPRQAPFHPDQAYPEYVFGECGEERNFPYEAVRESFHAAGLDAEHFGTPAWNPLRGLINPGETVLLKPNLVKEFHPRDIDGWQYVLTHGSVIRAVADYVWKALEGRGRIIIADAPHTDSSFDAMVPLLGLDVIRDFYRAEGLDMDLVDLRQDEWTTRDSVIVRRVRRPGDPNDYVLYDLAEASEFVGHAGAGRYMGADYDTRTHNRHHSGGRHEYLISGSAIKCDVVFSIPKLKTHKKAGITVSLKNLVGINGDKNYLPHHTEGSPHDGGDEHPNPDLKHKSERILVHFFYKVSLRVPVVGPWLHRQARLLGMHIFGKTDEVIRSGNWWGNDTTWRMCLDLNKILLYGNPDGTLRPAKPENRKRHYVLVDGIIAGEGRGPMDPDRVPAGTVVFGLHPASVDAACACLMGFDPDRIPIVRQAFRCKDYPLAEWDWREVRLVSNQAEWNGLLATIPVEATFHFAPHFGWKGHIERSSLTPSEGQSPTQTHLSPMPDLASARRA